MAQCSGHVQSGEVSIQAMIRELNEELGIDENEGRNIKGLGSLLIDFHKVGGNFKCIADIFLFRREEEHLRLQDEEVKGIEYYDLEEALALIREGKTRLPYDENYEKIFEKLKEELGIKSKEDNKMTR